MTQRSSSFEVRAFPMARLPVGASKVYLGSARTDLVELIFYSWLLRSADTVIVVDTGLPPAGADRDLLVAGNAAGDAREMFTDIDDLGSAYAHWGITPTDVDHVIITQTITYHTGSLLPRFLPRAQVHLALPGVVELLTEDVGHPARHLYFTPSTWSFLLDTAIAGRLRPISGTVDVCTGVSLTVTGGHHPGSAAVSVDTADGSICLLETAFRQENITEDVPIGIAEHVQQARRAMREARHRHDQVVAIHDPRHRETYP